MRKRILFVNSDSSEVQAMGRSGSPGRDWDFVFQDSASMALEQLAEIPPDAVVTAQNLSDMNGMDLLDEIIQQCPNTKTMLLADLEERNSGLNCVGTPYQVLAKPCDRKHLTAALDRAFDPDAWSPSEAARRLTSQMTKLPSLPYLYFRVLRELHSPEPSLEEVGAIVARDPSMSAKLLQFVNSASLGLMLEVLDPCEAVMHLGFKRTQSLLLLAHTCSFFESIKDSHLSVEALWQHSLRTGRFAQSIAKAEGSPANVVEEAFTAGLLHDIGKLAMAANHPARFEEAQGQARNSKNELEAERKVFVATHAEVAACLLTTWGLPWSIIQAVAFHHAPVQIGKKGFCPLTAVHAANAIDLASKGDNKSCTIDNGYLTKVDSLNQFENWQKICRSEARV